MTYLLRFLGVKLYVNAWALPTYIAWTLGQELQVMSFNYINEWYCNKNLNMIQNNYMTSESAKQEGIETQKSLM